MFTCQGKGSFYQVYTLVVAFSWWHLLAVGSCPLQLAVASGLVDCSLTFGEGSHAPCCRQPPAGGFDFPNRVFSTSLYLSLDPFFTDRRLIVILIFYSQFDQCEGTLAPKEILQLFLYSSRFYLPAVSLDI